MLNAGQFFNDISVWFKVQTSESGKFYGSHQFFEFLRENITVHVNGFKNAQTLFLYFVEAKAVGHLLGFYNIPIILWGVATASVFNELETYPTLATTVGVTKA